MKCLTKAVGTIVFILLFANVAFVSRAADITINEAKTLEWGKNGNVDINDNYTFGGGISETQQVTHEIYLHNDINLRGRIEIKRHTNLKIINNLGRTVTIKVAANLDNAFKVIGTLYFNYYGNEANRIILDGGADLRLNGYPASAIPNVGSINSGSTFVKNGTPNITYELIGSSGTLDIKFVTFQNYQNLSASTASAIKLGCDWSTDVNESYMGQTFIDNCIFQYLDTKQGSAIYMECKYKAASNSNPWSRNNVQIKNSVFRYCRSSVDGGAIYANFDWRGQVFMINTEMHHNWTPGNGGCISWNANKHLLNPTETTPSYTYLHIGHTTGCNLHDNISGADGGVLYAPENTWFWLEKSSFTSNSCQRFGGVVYANNAEVKSQDCTYESNQCPYRGAGLYITNNCTAEITGGEFKTNKLISSFTNSSTPNHEGYGAGIYFGNGGSMTMSGVKFNGNEITANAGSATGGGGAAIAIANQQYGVSSDETKNGTSTTTATLSGLTMSGNKALSGDGGAILIRNVDEANQSTTISKAKKISVALSSSTFSGCQAVRGGAIFVDGTVPGLGNKCYEDVNLTMDNVTMTGNTATYAGAIGVHRAQASFASGKIYRNSATSTAATGVTATGGMWSEGAKGFGGGIFVSNGAKFDITSGEGVLCAIYNNTATNGGNDIVADGAESFGTKTQLTLPDLAKVNLATFDGSYAFPVKQRAMGWIEDYNDGDTGYSSGFHKGATGRYRTKRANRLLNIENLMLSPAQRTPTGNDGKYLALSAGFPLYLVKLQKEGLVESSESAIFKIYGGSFTSDNPYLTTLVSGNAPTCNVVLTPGDWTFEENNWSWAYNPDNKTKTIDVSIDKDDTVFKFTNNPKSNIPPHAESKQPNNFE